MASSGKNANPRTPAIDRSAVNKSPLSSMAKASLLACATRPLPGKREHKGRREEARSFRARTRRVRPASSEVNRCLTIIMSIFVIAVNARAEKHRQRVERYLLSLLPHLSPVLFRCPMSGMAVITKTARVVKVTAYRAVEAEPKSRASAPAASFTTPVGRGRRRAGKIF